FSTRIVITISFIFFFQAEDGIRDPLVTGVQTCALPIYHHTSLFAHHIRGIHKIDRVAVALGHLPAVGSGQHRHFGVKLFWLGERSEERRVGKGWRYRWGLWH